MKDGEMGSFAMYIHETFAYPFHTVLLALDISNKALNQRIF